MPRIHTAPYTDADAEILVRIAKAHGSDSFGRVARMIYDDDADLDVMLNIEDGKLLDAQYHNYCINYDEYYGI